MTRPPPVTRRGVTEASEAPRAFPGDGIRTLCDEPTAIEREAWLVWNKYGSRPYFAHPSEDRANEEAARLASLHPGKSFLVMRSMRKFRVEKPEPDSQTVVRQMLANSVADLAAADEARTALNADLASGRE